MFWSKGAPELFNILIYLNINIFNKVQQKWFILIPVGNSLKETFSNLSLSRCDMIIGSQQAGMLVKSSNHFSPKTSEGYLTGNFTSVFSSHKM